MTKADQIRALSAAGETSTRIIADTVGCLTSYVRVVLRQRINGKISQIDKAYLAKQKLKQQVKRARKLHDVRDATA